MEHIVAVRVSTTHGADAYFLTWGRLFGATGEDATAQSVFRYAHCFDIDGQPDSAEVCPTLQTAALSENAPYFYECLLTFFEIFGQRASDPTAWTAERIKAVEAGREIAFCGRTR